MSASPRSLKNLKFAGIDGQGASWFSDSKAGAWSKSSEGWKHHKSTEIGLQGRIEVLADTNSNLVVAYGTKDSVAGYSVCRLGKWESNTLGGFSTSIRRAFSSLPGRVWFVAHEYHTPDQTGGILELDLISGKTLRTLRSPDIPTFVHTIAATGDATWFGGNSLVGELEGNMKLISHPVNLSLPWINQIVIDGPNTWIGTSHYGLFRMDEGIVAHQQGPENGFYGTKVSGLVKARMSLWATTENGVQRFDGHQWHDGGLPKAATDRLLDGGIYPDNEDGLWLNLRGPLNDPEARWVVANLAIDNPPLLHVPSALPISSSHVIETCRSGGLAQMLGNPQTLQGSPIRPG